MKYYKVVKHTKSLNISISNGGVTYTLSDWCYPKIKGSKLCVFNSIKKASNAMRGDYNAHLYDAHLYECKIKNPPKPYVLRSNTIDHISDYWTIVAQARKAKKSINRALLNTTNCSNATIKRYTTSFQMAPYFVMQSN